MKTFTRHEFEMLGVCSDGLARVEAFGGAIENSLAGWQAYIDANPEAWRAPLFTAWRLHKRGNIACPDLIWKVARIAFREQPERNAALRVYGETLGPGNWREARTAAYADVVVVAAAAAGAYAYAAAAHADAADADAAADAADAADAARKRVRAEIVAMAVEALDTLNH